MGKLILPMIKRSETLNTDLLIMFEIFSNTETSFNSQLIILSVRQMLKEVSYRALPSALVEKIELDVGGMRVGDTIRVRDLAIASDKDVQLQTDLDTVVVEVYASKNTAADEDAEDGGLEAEGK